MLNNFCFGFISDLWHEFLDASMRNVGLKGLVQDGSKCFFSLTAFVGGSKYELCFSLCSEARPVSLFEVDIGLLVTDNWLDDCSTSYDYREMVGPHGNLGLPVELRNSARAG